MSSKLSRWLRSKAGTRTIVGVVAVLAVVAIVGQLLGWWAGLVDLLSGTVVGPEEVYYDPPQDGVTCLPTCELDDGKFLLISGVEMRTFAGSKIVAWINVPGQYESFELSIFDGDAGKDPGGGLTYWKGNWDDTTNETTYTLFADPLKKNMESSELAHWTANAANPTSGPGWTASADTMPNNDWYTLTVENTPKARGSSGHYFYRLEITMDPKAGKGGNAFKLRSNAYLTTGLGDLGEGEDDLVEASFSIVAQLATAQDVPILYDFTGNYNNPGEPKKYTGDWTFYIHVPEEQETMSLWDGDFDRGTSASVAPDTDDFNTEGIPPWADPTYANPEGAWERGAPADNYWAPLTRVGVPVWYELIDPEGVPIYTNDEPSGTEEWEHYTISTNPGEQPDLQVEEIKPGYYTLQIEGLDFHNLVFLRTNYEICPPDDCGPPPCDATCPRTIGYWKNNVKKVLIEGRTKGVQETEESIMTALDLIAQYSPLFRHGIDVTNPQPIDTVEPLTAEEAHMILQRDQKTYPGGKDQANSMLARALQQNLAAWLNWGSGKVCDGTVVTLDVTDGRFEGKLWDALQEAQDIILNGGNLERAKDIGDQINNGNLGEDANLEVTTCDITNPDDTNSKDYRDKFPADKQPPRHEDKVKGPKPPKKEPKAPDPAPDPETCEGVRVNRYGVEITNDPFAGIKFEYQSGTEVKNGDFEEFKLVLTQEQAQALTAVQMEAKAGASVGQATLEGCDFSSGMPCSGEPVWDENHFFAFYFMGAEDNGDGTLTLTFHVQNMTDAGLSHATIGIPDAEVPGSYESKVCP
jgi:hypothetical protein